MIFGFIDHKKIVERAIMCGIGEALYIAFVALFISVGGQVFAEESAGKIFGFASILILLVIGVAVSALLIFGYPLYYFLQKKYREAVMFAVTALGTLSLILALILLCGVIIF